MINYDKVWKYIQAPADFMTYGNREGINSQQSHQSQAIQWNLRELLPLFSIYNTMLKPV